MDWRSFVQTHDRILLDGAMGTELDKRGLMSRGDNNLVAPDAVLEIHREYARSGCHVLITNTLTMNRIYIETHGVGVDVREVNEAGAELARQAAREGQYVLGDISSTGQLLQPYGTYKESDFYDAFEEQAGALAGAGVDGFIVETMFDLREAVCAEGQPPPASGRLDGVRDRGERGKDHDGQLSTGVCPYAHRCRRGRGRRQLRRS